MQTDRTYKIKKIIYIISIEAKLEYSEGKPNKTKKINQIVSRKAKLKNFKGNRIKRIENKKAKKIIT